MSRLRERVLKSSSVRLGQKGRARGRKDLKQISRKILKKTKREDKRWNLKLKEKFEKKLIRARDQLIVVLFYLFIGKPATIYFRFC